MAEPISIDDFKKVELLVAVVEGVERVPNTDKLLKFSLKVGEARRQIVSGIADHYQDLEALKGMRVIIIANLQPRMIRGVESQGMILTAVQPDGKLSLLSTEREIADGTPVM